MKKAIVPIIVLIAIALIAVVTCPDKQDHKDAILSVVNETIGDELGASDQENEDIIGILGGLASIGTHVSGWYLDSNLTVKNYFVFSTGVLKYGQESEVVSVGVFGHVFTGDKEDVKRIVSGQ